MPIPTPPSAYKIDNLSDTQLKLVKNSLGIYGNEVFPSVKTGINHAIDIVELKDKFTYLVKSDGQINNGDTLSDIKSGNFTVSLQNNDLIPASDICRVEIYATNATVSLIRKDIATTEQVFEGLNDNKIITPLKITQRNEVKTKVVNIGVWDIVANQSISFLSSLVFETLIGVDAYIVSDNGAASNTFNISTMNQAFSEAGGYCGVFPNGAQEVQINLHANPLGMFNNSNYNDPTVNRGFAVVKYI